MFAVHSPVCIQKGMGIGYGRSQHEGDARVLVCTIHSYCSVPLLNLTIDNNTVDEGIIITCGTFASKNGQLYSKIKTKVSSCYWRP